MRHWVHANFQYKTALRKNLPQCSMANAGLQTKTSQIADHMVEHYLDETRGLDFSIERLSNAY
jgi:hypothetical protein